LKLTRPHRPPGHSGIQSAGTDSTRAQPAPCHSAPAVLAEAWCVGPAEAAELIDRSPGLRQH